jgi:hypothetical protein
MLGQTTSRPVLLADQNEGRFVEAVGRLAGGVKDRIDVHDLAVLCALKSQSFPDPGIREDASAQQARLARDGTHDRIPNIDVPTFWILPIVLMCYVKKKVLRKL